MRQYQTLLRQWLLSQHASSIYGFLAGLLIGLPSNANTASSRGGDGTPQTVCLPVATMREQGAWMCDPYGTAKWGCVLSDGGGAAWSPTGPGLTGLRLCSS